VIEDSIKEIKSYNFEFTTDLSSDSGQSNNFKPVLEKKPYT